MLIGATKSGRSKHAWAEVYRSLAHGPARSACEDKTVIGKFPRPVVDFAAAFVELQAKRHIADYDPYAVFRKSAVLFHIEMAERVMENFSSVDVKDRRAFASWLLFRNVARR
ncbi:MULTISPECIES: hypothetical protein [Azorhizobium]|uniref:hypothetical protein n=1 Tax=Azorhizobium TaxID=6 RepID=UPI00105BAAF4|nr:hypothetical protein [Azorhizobium sp. AG788]TDT91374.1 hypothetical protein DFO45_3930 [Azorhizobium sp. AG788]